LLATYRRRIGAARAEMARLGAEGVPSLIVGEGAKRKLLRSDAFIGSLDALNARLQAA
jgi:putative protein-disulfide isomerase